MLSFDGILNYTFTFTTIIIIITLLKSYKKSLKTNLGQSVSSFLSIIVCIYFIFTYKQINLIYEFIQSIGFNKEYFIIILFIVFTVLYMIIKVLIKIFFRFFRVKAYLSKDTKIHKRISIGFVLMRKSLFMIYFITVLTLLYSEVYYTGITKPIVNTPLIKTNYFEVFNEIERIEDAIAQSSEFTDLFSAREMKDQVENFDSLVSEEKSYEKTFLSEIYPDLSLQDKELVSQKYFDNYENELNRDSKGILVVLLKDNLYKDLLSEEDSQPIKQYLSKIPYLNDFVYKEEMNAIRLVDYIDNNKELIVWINTNRDLIEEYQQDKIDKIFSVNFVNQFVQDYDKVSNISDKDNQRLLNDIYTSIDKYYLMQNLALTLMESNEDFTPNENEKTILDTLIYDYLKDAKHLDQIILEFNSTYKKGRFKKYEQELESVYQLTKRYLKNDKAYSLSIDANLDPKTRLSAAIIRDDKLKDILYNERSLNQLLTYMNSECYETLNNCDVNKTFDLMDLLLWGYFTEDYIDSNSQEKIRISSKKLSDFYESVDEMNGSNIVNIKKEMIKLNEKLLFSNRKNHEDSYIKEYYYYNILGYDVLKVLHKQDDFINFKSKQSIQELIK